MRGETQIEIDGVDFFVEYEYTLGSKGYAYTKYGDPGEPDDEDEIEVLSAKVCGVDVWELLGARATSIIEDKCAEDARRK